ncbi:MAG: virulence factor SrfC family protein [Pseudomonadota bacterium]
MFQSDQELSDFCSKVSDKTGELVQWIDRNNETVGSEGASTIKKIKKEIRALKKCRIAAERKMCVGVFGPSQAGKSYLVSSLAKAPDLVSSLVKKPDAALVANFGGKKYDFLADINPPGDKESTGLVTRFTMTPPDGLSDEYPVQLKLLSELDLVRILTNAYYNDCEELEPPGTDMISARIGELTAKRISQADGSFDEDEMADLAEYVSKNFKKKIWIAALGSAGFWETAIHLAPVLDQEDRIKLFSLLWNDIDPITQLFKKLTCVLASLGYASTAFVAIHALIPREKSIIDVETLLGLGDDEGERLEITTNTGIKVKTIRAVLTALTSELTVLVDQKPDDMFDHTDLLDFPGYRSRLKLETDHLIQNREKLRDFYLRGKVAYLFEQYNMERELTSMLLCIGNSTQEVNDLPGVIEQWIHLTHGETSKQRTGRPVSLFLILTKFDVHFDEKTGETDFHTRWTSRLEASFLKNFGSGEKSWTMNWDDKGPFNNIYCFRNPSYKAKHLFSYSGDQEVGLLESEVNNIEKLKKGFCENPDVQRHIKEPSSAWDSLMSLNDGGMTYLRENLRPLCNPQLKRGQIYGEVKDSVGKILSWVKHYYKAEDMEQKLADGEAQARRTSSVLNHVYNKKKFGDLLRTLIVSDAAIYDLYFKMNETSFDSSVETGSSPPPLESRVADTLRDSGQGEDLLGDLFGDDAPSGLFADTAPEANNTPVPSSSVPVDDVHFFTNEIEKYWIETIQDAANNLSLQNYLGIPEQTDYLNMTNELITGARRLGIFRTIESELRRLGEYGNIQRDRLAWKFASKAVYIINSYISWLGFNPGEVPESDRVVVIGDKSLNIFPSKEPVGDYPNLTEQKATYHTQYCQHWITAFYYLSRQNIQYDGEVSYDVHENAALGKILSSIEFEESR